MGGDLNPERIYLTHIQDNVDGRQTGEKILLNGNAYD